MNNKDFKNFQNSLYNNILPPESLKYSRGEGFDTHKSLNHIPDLSDSEHTQSSQTRSDERFRMTEECHPEEFSSRHPEASAEGSMYILDSCQRLKQGSKNTICHPEERSELRILPVINDCQEHWSDSEHTQSSQTCKDGRFRMTLLRSVQTAALTLALSFFIAAPAMAADTPPVPAPAQTDNSAYTLTKVDQPGTNVITKYEWSETDNKLVPQYYQVNLNKTEYGYHDIADDTKTFTVTTPNPDGSGNAFEYEINYYVDNDRLAPDRITTNGADIDKDFVDDSAVTQVGAAQCGGAIEHPTGEIGSITGDFVNNAAHNNYDNVALGGAIYNRGKIKDITGNFIDNYAYSNGSRAEGGAIYNSGLNGSSAEIGDITGGFIGNYVSATDEANGGAIYNSYVAIGDITGDFIGNYASATDGANGGAIYNYYATIGNITGDFIGNYASGSGSNSSTNGGAICNGGTIGNITGDFIGNYVSGRSSAYGGAIGNGGTIGNITGDFVGNYVSGDILAIGGAIAQEAGFIKNINGNFIGNYAVSDSGYAMGARLHRHTR